MHAAPGTQIARSIETGHQDFRAWDVFASCDEFYWNRAGKDQRLRLRSSFVSGRAAIAVCLKPEHFVEARNILEREADTHAWRVLAWVTSGQTYFILLSVPDPVPRAIIDQMFALPGALYLEPDLERTARLYGLQPRDSTFFDPIPEPCVLPPQVPPQPRPSLEEQKVIKQMHLPPISPSLADGNHIIAVIDDGVEWDHSYIAPHLWRNDGSLTLPNCDNDDERQYVSDCIGWNFQTNSPNPQPEDRDFDHGTLVAGLAIAVAKSAGVPVRLMPLRTQGSGNRLSLAAFSRAIDYASRHGAKTIAIALSWCLREVGSQEHHEVLALQRAANCAMQRGALIVCAAGNQFKDIIKERQEPARLGLTAANVLTVQGVGPGFKSSNFTTTNPDQLIVAAGGRNILSISTGNKFDVEFSQTSASTAIVAGVSAVLAVHKQINDPGQLKSLLLACRDPCATDPGELAARLLDLSFLP